MRKPIIKNDSPESYESLKKYAESLSGQLIFMRTKLTHPEDLTRIAIEAKHAWKEVHDMAIAVSKNFADSANSALTVILRID